MERLQKLRFVLGMGYSSLFLDRPKPLALPLPSCVVIVSPSQAPFFSRIKFLLILICLLAIFMASCAGGGTDVKKEELIPPKQSKYRSILVIVKSDLRDEKIVEDISMLETAIVVNIWYKRLFDKVVGSISNKDYKADLTLTAKIVDAKGASLGARMTLGIFAGVSRTAADVQLFDNKNHKSLGSIDMSQSSQYGKIGFEDISQAYSILGSRISFLVAEKIR